MPVWKFFQPCGCRHEMDANNVTEALDLPLRESGANHHGQAASAGFLVDRNLNQVGIAILMIDLKRLRWQYQAKGRIRCLSRPGNGPVRLEPLPALNRNMRKAVARSSRYDTSPNRLCHTQRVILHPAPDPEVPASEGGMKEGGGAVDLGLFQHLLAGGQAVGDGLHLTAVGPIHLLPGQPVLQGAVVGDFIADTIAGPQDAAEPLPIAVQSHTNTLSGCRISRTTQQPHHPCRRRPGTHLHPQPQRRQRRKPRHSLDGPMLTATGRGAGYRVDMAAEPFMWPTQPQLAQGPGRTQPSPTATHGAGHQRPHPGHRRRHILGEAHHHSLPRRELRPGRGEAPQRHHRLQQQALIKAILIEYYGNSDAADIEAPLPAVTGRDRHGLASPVIVQVNHGNGELARRATTGAARPWTILYPP